MSCYSMPRAKDPSDVSVNPYIKICMLNEFDKFTQVYRLILITHL